MQRGEHDAARAVQDAAGRADEQPQQQGGVIPATVRGRHGRLDALHQDPRHVPVHARPRQRRLQPLPRRSRLVHPKILRREGGRTGRHPELLHPVRVVSFLQRPGPLEDRVNYSEFPFDRERRRRIFPGGAANDDATAKIALFVSIPVAVVLLVLLTVALYLCKRKNRNHTNMCRYPARTVSMEETWEAQSLCCTISAL
uniref:Uncharacterized protein n=1 Tax=Triticum urartu TaxID=4572 RepID=A0A8R7VFF7_TRIUA